MGVAPNIYGGWFRFLCLKCGKIWKSTGHYGDGTGIKKEKCPGCGDEIESNSFELFDPGLVNDD